MLNLARVPGFSSLHMQWYLRITFVFQQSGPLGLHVFLLYSRSFVSNFLYSAPTTCPFLPFLVSSPPYLSVTLASPDVLVVLSCPFSAPTFFFVLYCPLSLSLSSSLPFYHTPTFFSCYFLLSILVLIVLLTEFPPFLSPFLLLYSLGWHHSIARRNCKSC